MFKTEVRNISESLYHDNVSDTGELNKAITVTEIKRGDKVFLISNGDY